ncbi:hypothetical protein MMC17_009002 [Xylographa soralifera]|nr:hypothetical protein [Xylographa soralifera]
MADTPSAIDEALRLTESFVPVIDIDWIEGVLDGTIDLPKFQMGDEVCVVDHTPDQEYDSCPDHSSVGLPPPVHPERNADERLRHVTHEDIINSYCSCEVAPSFSYRMGKPVTAWPPQVDFSISRSICTDCESCTEARHSADPDHSIAGAYHKSKDAMYQLAEAVNNQDCEHDTEVPASTTSDDQWKDVFPLLQLEEGETQMKLNRSADAKASPIPSTLGPSKEDHGSRTLEEIGATVMDDQLGPEEDSGATRATRGTTNLKELVPGHATEIASTPNEVGAGRDKETCGDSLHTDTSGPTPGEDGLIEMSEDNDWVCICVSDKVARVAKKAREDVLVNLTKVLGFLVKDETDFPYQKETNPWMVQLFDERLHKAFQRILVDLECLEEVNMKPKHGHGHPHINSRMSKIIKDHIENIGKCLVAEVEAMMLVKDFLADMVDHELGIIASPKRGTNHEFIAAMNRHFKVCGGLNERFLSFLGYLLRLSPQERMSLPKRNVGPGRRIEGHYYQRFVELPMERWGGLESLLDIHENDAVMNALATSIYRIAVSGAYLNIGSAAAAGFGEVCLSEVVAGVKLRIWLGEEEIATYSPADIRTYITYHHPVVSFRHRQVEDTLQDVTKTFTIKHIYHRPETSPQLVIKTDNKDFYRLYRQYMGKIHPEEVDGPYTPAPQDSAWGIKLVCVGVESLDVDLDDFKQMMETYDCEDYNNVFTQRLMPPRPLITHEDVRWPRMKRSGSHDQLKGTDHEIQSTIE